MTTQPPTPIGDEQTPIVVRRGRVDSVDLYEIKDSELDLLEKGSRADLQLNFAIFLFSIAFSAICALVTATFSDSKVELVFIFVAVVGIIVGAYLLMSWYQSRKSHREVCQQIRDRMPTDASSLNPTSTPAGEDVTPK